MQSSLSPFSMPLRIKCLKRRTESKGRGEPYWCLWITDLSLKRWYLTHRAKKLHSNIFKSYWKFKVA